MPEDPDKIPPVKSFNRGSNIAPMRLLAIGPSVRHVAQSASRFADVVAIDEFGDLDTRSFSDSWATVEEVNPGNVSEVLKEVEYDRAVTTSPYLLSTLELLGNSVEEMRTAGDKLLFARYCEREGLPHPETSTSPGEGTPLEKPRLGGGGVGNRLSREKSSGCIYQDVLGGDGYSVSLVSNGSQAEAVAFNRTFSGVEACDPPGPFAFCGNLTPSGHVDEDEAVDVSEKIARDYGLKGSVGVDFLLGDEVVPLEVNPRIQASLDTVEAALGLSVTESHVETCRAGELRVSRTGGGGGHACRLVVYAAEDVVAPDLTGMEIRDVPEPGRPIEKGDPVTSVLRTGDSEGEAFAAAVEAVEDVKGVLY